MGDVLANQNDSKVEWWARAHSAQIDAYRLKPGCPEAFGFKVYSQSDEDGIIDEIFRRIGTTTKIFVEFGAESGIENNSRYLLENGWSGLWIEGNESGAQLLAHLHRDKIESGHLKAINCYVTRENINDLISGAGISGEIDLLSIDIDSIDYHVWDAISVINPRLIVAEHNYDPPPVHYVMPYDAGFRWNGEGSGFGASLVANVQLATSKGYSLVATGLYSPNGFYVRNDLLQGRFPGPHDAASNYRPLNYEALINFPGPPSAAQAGLLSASSPSHAVPHRHMALSERIKRLLGGLSRGRRKA